MKTRKATIAYVERLKKEANRKWNQLQQIHKIVSKLEGDLQYNTYPDDTKTTK